MHIQLHLQTKLDDLIDAAQEGSLEVLPVLLRDVLFGELKERVSVTGTGEGCPLVADRGTPYRTVAQHLSLNN